MLTSYRRRHDRHINSFRKTITQKAAGGGQTVEITKAENMNAEQKQIFNALIQ